MKQANKLTAPHDAAAAAFYGLSDAEFAEQIAKLSANDPRLIAVFKMTRANFLASRNN